MKKAYFFIIISYCVILYSSASEDVLSNIKISNAWVRPGPPVVSMRAGYFEITNHATQDVIIDDVSSPAFEQVELHQTVLQNKMASMDYVETIILKKGHTLTFKPGGFHLMLMKPKYNLSINDTIKIWVHFVGLGNIIVDAVIRNP